MKLRGLSEVRAAGDDAWFAPALDLLRSLPDHPNQRLRTFFSADSPLNIARAPGRLDVMGGIADYSGSLVLELPLACSTSVVLQRQPAPAIDLLSRRRGAWHQFTMDLESIVSGELRDAGVLAAWFAHQPEQHWAAYVIGCIQHCLQRAPTNCTGFRLLIDSSVPEGKGVSSSAALEVAVMSATAASCDVAMTCAELALACQWVENHIVGAPCGVMDQMTCACGQRNRLLRLRCQPSTIEDYIEVPAGYRCYGIDSGVRHAVTGAEYSTVRSAAFMGLRMIAELSGTAPDYLANITPGEFATRFEPQLPEYLSGREFLERYGDITDPVTRVRPDLSYPVRQATAHPIHENDRVAQFANLLGSLPQRPDAAIELGQLMRESHASYNACGLGNAGTDRLVELVTEAGADSGLFGAKITGGGSGGTVAIFGTAAAQPLVHEIAARYSAQTQRASTVFAASGPSAGETGVLVVEAIAS